MRDDDDDDDDDGNDRDVIMVVTVKRASKRKGSTIAREGDDNAADDAGDGDVADGAVDVEDDAARDEDDDEAGDDSGANGSYVGVRDADVGELSTQYTQRAEAQEALEGGKMSREEVDRLVAEVMRFMLFMTHKENGAPVTRTKIGECIAAAGGAGGKSRGGSYIVALAQKRFLEIFGFEMVECSKAQSRNRKQPKTVEAASAAPVKCYALRSVLPAQMRRKYVDKTEDLPERALAMVVSALVQIASGCIREDALFEQLSKLGINKDERHPKFGDVQELLGLLVKRRVFLRERAAHDDPSQGYCFELAEGAMTLIGYENIDKFVTDVMRTQRA